MKKISIIAAILIALFGLVIIFKLQKEDLPENGSFATSTPAAADSPLVLVPHEVQIGAGESVSFNAPADISINLAAGGLGRARFMAWSPDRRLFVTDMHDLTDNSLGKINILSGFSDAAHTFATTTVYLDHLRNPNSVAFYHDKAGAEWLYVALTDRLIRYPYHAGDTHPTAAPEVLAHFPDYGLSYKYGGWHLTRTIAFHDNVAYISVGSSCNSCEEKESIRASITSMNPDGSDFKPYVTGLRNAVGLKFVGNDLYATDMGADQYGPDLPKEKLYKLREGTNYGWPYCLQGNGEVLAASTTAWTKQFDCSTVPTADAEFQAHAAPLGLEYFDPSYQIPELQDSFLVALHGASTPSIGHGYSIVKVKKSGEVANFITGFLKGTTSVSRIGRPADIIQNDSRSFFFTDDLFGRLYYVSGN